MSFNIDEKTKNTLLTNNTPLKAPSNYTEAKALRVIGVDFSYTGGRLDYNIFDYQYYDALKKNHYDASLINMIALHNQLLLERK